MKSLRIFVVDDDVDFAESLAEVLSNRGHIVEMAHDGEDAIDRFRNNDFDITFMDVKLPGKNGVESFLEIRNLKPDAKIMMMTGYSIEQLLQQAVDNGALGILHKPFSFDKVFETLKKIEPDGLILIADDDPDFAGSLDQFLTENGYRVAVSHSGDEALRMGQRTRYDALVLDFRMPVINGLDVYLTLKKRGHLIPTIIVTGYADEASSMLGALKQDAMIGCLFKPFNPTLLLAALEEKLT